MKYLKISKFLRHIQLINDVLNVLYLSSGYNFGLQNLLKDICVINTQFGNKTTIIS